VTGFISNARMYAVSPEAEALWREVLARVTAEADVALTYTPYPAPQPLEHLWARRDLGAVFMCGYPIALRIANVVPLAAPIPNASWAAGQALYRSDFIVRKDATFQTLADTFDGTAGWTVEHSHSGFNAFRHHLLPYRTQERPNVYRQMKGNLITARRVLDCVLDGSIDTGPLDAYWHMLIARHKPELTAGIRVLESTAVAPMPAFVAAPGLPDDTVSRLRQAFATAHTRPWFAAMRDMLLIEGFAPVTRDSFTATLHWDQAAKAAGYPFPA
jgi:ABC-type phosphate/phosphonate transport system substrate-binding protein